MWAWLATTKLGHATIGLVACLIVGGVLFGYGFYRGDKHRGVVDAAQLATLQAQIAQANLKATAAARASENAQADALTQAAASYERGKTDAQADANSVIAGLRAGNLKLRDYWTQGHVGGVPASGASVAATDAAEQRRQESAGRIIGSTEQCVSQVAALQQVIRGYLKAINGASHASQ